MLTVNRAPFKSRQSVLAPFLALYCLTVATQLISLAYGRINEQQTFASIVLPSIIFLSVLTLPAVAIGIFLGRKVGLGVQWTTYPGSYQKLLSDGGLACVLGVALGGTLLLVRIASAPYLPPELPAFGHKGVIGGLAVSLGAAVAEEVWFRLGLMTLLVWGVSHAAGHKETRPIVVWVIIFITAFGFAVAHLPQLMSYGAGSQYAIAGTIGGNVAVGVLYGWCYWRRSLVAAMVAHFSVDVVLHVLPALLQ